MDETCDIRRKRLLYRSWHRGTKELDLLLGRFADRHLDGFSSGQLERYEAILEEEEGDIYAWLTGRQPVPTRHDNNVMTLILSFKFYE